MRFSDYKNIFNFHGKGFYALGRVYSAFREVHAFDLKRRVDTSTIKIDGYADPRYMIYQPVYTSICVEMIRKAFEWYTSGIRYSRDNLITIFVDLGAGSGKTVILANESNYFDFCAGVELDKELHERSKTNLPPKSVNREKKTKILHILSNVEHKEWIDKLTEDIPDEKRSNIVLFAFNKNSYNGEVVDRTLRLMSDRFNNILYLYQNPIHHRVVTENGFFEIQRDGYMNNAHKNRKYILYHKSN